MADTSLPARRGSCTHSGGPQKGNPIAPHFPSPDSRCSNVLLQFFPQALQSPLPKPGCQEPAAQSLQPEPSLLSCKIHSCRHARTCRSIINRRTADEPTRAFLDACLNRLGHTSKPGRDPSHLTRCLLPRCLSPCHPLPLPQLTGGLPFSPSS